MKHNDKTIWLFIKQYDYWWNNMIIHQTIWLLMKQYDCSSNNMIVDEIIWLFIKQYDYLWNSTTVHIKFQVPNAIFWYYKYPYNSIRKPHRIICPPWLNLLHNRNPHLETLGGSVFFQCGKNIFSLFIYKLHNHIALIWNLYETTLHMEGLITHSIAYGGLHMWWV